MRRFVKDIPFKEKISENEFNKILKDKKFNQFNEEGVVSSCPRCDFCKDGLLKLQIPNPNVLKDQISLQDSKRRMKSYFDIHIQKEIELEMQSIRRKIEEKIHSKYEVKPEI